MINNVLSGCLRILPILAVSLAGGLIEGNRSGWAATADLWQARNGTPTLPTSPVEWVRGNASPANSHYIEGYSIPYRMVLSGLTNGPHTLVIEWDTRLSGKHAGNRLLCRAVFAEPVKTYTEEELARANADPNWDPLLEFDYWRAQLAGLPASATDWFQHDLSSVFWEKRLRCALSAGGLQIPAQQLVSLQSDEVADIRDLAPKSG